MNMRRARREETIRAGAGGRATRTTRDCLLACRGSAGPGGGNVRAAVAGREARCARVFAGKSSTTEMPSDKSANVRCECIPTHAGKGTSSRATSAPLSTMNHAWTATSTKSSTHAGKGTVLAYTLQPNQRRPGVDWPLPFRRATSWRCNNLHLGRDPAESLFPRLQPPSGKPVTHQLNEWIGPVSSQQWSSSVKDCPEVSRRNCERKMHIAPAGRGVKSFYRTCPRPLHYQYTRGVTIIR